MPVTVLSIAYPFAPVSPETAGGAEQVLSALDQALVNAGETSLVVACQGSTPSGKLYSFPLPRCEVLEANHKAWGRKQTQAAIDRALSSHRVDLVHMHGMDFYEYSLPEGLPIIVTLHMPVPWYPPAAWNHADRIHFCCVSGSQRQSFHLSLQDCSVVENGVALPPFRAQQPAGDFALVMGRICPEKNAHVALQAGTLAGTPVLLAGKVFPYREHQQYFQQQIEPLLHTPQVNVQHKFLGPLLMLQRQDLLARARCLLHPTLAPETSSLVAMEAMAAGTPVIAYRSGALPHIVEHGVTGYIVDSIQEMADAIREVPAISRQACRLAAEGRFSQQRMIEGYFGLYGSVLRWQADSRRYA